jgi:hypothetical protein
LINPFERAVAELVHARERNELAKANFTTNQHIYLGYKLAQATSDAKRNTTWNARRAFNFSQGTNSQKAVLFGDDNHKRRAMHSDFCSKDQLAEARNAITLCSDIFVHTSIAIRLAARTLADDAICLRDHSQKMYPARENIRRNVWPW